MTDKEQIIIDVRKEQECEELKKEIDKIYEAIKLSPLCYKCSEEGCLRKEIDQLKQECEELKIKLIQKDEVNMFFNTPIEGWDNDPCKICESKNNYEQLKEDYAELERECERLKSHGATLLADKNATEIGRDDYMQRCKRLEQECEKLLEFNNSLVEEHKTIGNDLYKEIKEYRKKLQSKEQECEELKEELAIYKKMLDDPEFKIALTDVRTGEREVWRKLGSKTDRYRKALEEIEKATKINCEEICGRKFEDCNDTSCFSAELLGIVNKAKGEGNVAKIF